MNKRLIWILPVLIIIILLLFRSRSPFGKGNTSFASENGSEITRIELSEGLKKISIEKQGNSWLLNGEKEIRRNGALFLVRILQEMQIKSPVSPEMFKKEMKENNLKPVRVRTYNKHRLLRSFIVYKTRSNNYGNIMKMKENAKPFIMYVPGFDGNIGSAFTLNELFWMPYTIFDLLPSEIAKVSFESFADTANSFSIIRNGKGFTLNGNGRALSGYDSTQVARYLTYFTHIPFEDWSFETQDEMRNRIITGTLLYRITVEKPGGARTILTLWPKKILKDGLENIDTDRLYGKTDSSDELFIVRYYDIDPLIKKRSYFFTN